MVIDLWLRNAVVDNIFYKITLLVGEDVTLVMDKPEEMDDVFVNNDKVLQHEHKGTDIVIKALSVGVSKVRIMKDQGPGEQPKVIRELLFDVVDTITRPAIVLNSKLGSAQPK